MTESVEAGWMDGHGFKVMSDEERERRTVHPTAKSTADRLKAYERAIETIRKSQQREMTAE